MNSSFKSKKAKNKTLTSIVIFSLLIHLFGIYLLKDFTFERSTVFMPKQTLLGENALDVYSQSIKKKNLDLENIFSRLMAKSVLPDDVKFDFKDLDSSFIPDPEKKLNLYEVSLEKQIRLDLETQHSLQEVAPIEQVDLLKTLSPGNHTIESSYELTTSNDPMINTDYLDPASKESTVFPQLSLIDLIDSKNLTASIEPNIQAINLKEPILASSEDYFDKANTSDINRVLASSSDFMVNLEYAPQVNEDGFLFKLSLATLST